MANFDNYFYKKVIELRDKGYTVKDIAERLEVPVKTIETIIFNEEY